MNKKKVLKPDSKKSVEEILNKYLGTETRKIKLKPDPPIPKIPKIKPKELL